MANSQAIEKEGLIRCLQKLDNAKLRIASVTTDQHVQVRAMLRKDINNLMSENNQNIQHHLDVWHIAKSK